MNKKFVENKCDMNLLKNPADTQNANIEPHIDLSNGVTEC